MLLTCNTAVRTPHRYALWRFRLSLCILRIFYICCLVYGAYASLISLRFNTAGFLIATYKEPGGQPQPLRYPP